MIELAAIFRQPFEAIWGRARKARSCQADEARLKLAPQNAAMRASMIVNNFNIPSIAILEPEADGAQLEALSKMADLNVSWKAFGGIRSESATKPVPHH